MVLCISRTIGCCADVPGVPAHHNERKYLDTRAGIKMFPLTTRKVSILPEHASHLRRDSVVVRVLQHQHVDADAAQVPAQALQHVVTHHPQILGLYRGSALHTVPRHTLVLIAHVPAGTLTSLETSQTPTLGFKHNNSRSLVQLLGI